MAKQEQTAVERPDAQLEDDSPIEAPKQDKFGRMQFVQNLANALIAETKQETKSKVIALAGKWGVGKTSVINMVKAEIKKSAPKNLFILDFNPWQYTDNEDLIKPFLEELYLSIQEQKGKVKKVRRAVAEYYKEFDTENIKKNFSDLIGALIALAGGIISGNEAKNASEVIIPVIRNADFKITNVNFIFLYWIPVILFGLLFLSSICKFLKVKISSKVSFEKKTLVSQKNEVSKELIENKIHLIVIIDDIDRLTPKETLQLFRIIRTNADFENTTYLLSFDKDVVVKNLKSENVMGDDFIEKIITSEYVVSEPPNFYLRKFLSEELEKTACKNEKWKNDVERDYYRFGQLIFEAVESLVTMRDVKRYLNSLKLHLKNLVNDNIAEVNFIDIACVECLMLKYRDCYYGIKNNKVLLTQTTHESVRRTIKNIFANASGDDKYTQELNEKKNAIKKSISQIAKSETELMMVLLLFPNLYFVYEGEIKRNLLPPYRADQTAASNICIPNYFDSYFTNSFSIDDPIHISNKELTDFINNTYNKENIMNFFEECRNKGKFSLLINILYDVSKTGNFIPEENAVHFTAAMFDVQFILTEQERQKLHFSIFDACNEIIFAYLKNFNKEACNILLKAIEETTTLYPLGTFIDLQNASLNNGNTSVMFFKDGFDKVKKTYIKKLSDYYKNNKTEFWENIYLESLLRYWHTFDSKSFNTKFGKEISTDKKLCKLMIVLYKARQTKTFSYFPYNSIQFFGNLDKIKARLENALGSGKLAKKEKVIAEFYINNFVYMDSQFGLVENKEVLKLDAEYIGKVCI